MSNYDLGSIGWVVENKGTKESLVEVAALGEALLGAEQSALVFVRAILKMERDMKLLAKANEEANDRLLSFRRTTDAITGVSKDFKSAEQSASVFTVVLDNLENQAKKTAIEINKITGVDNIPAVNSGAGASTLEAEYTRLKLEFDQVYASSQLYESSIKELNAAHRIGAISTRQYQVSLDSLNREYQEFSNGTANATNRFVAQSRQGALGFNSMGVAVQQVGYQVGDFLVQIQSGTNVLVAFGQQATQLAGLLTTFGGKWLGIGVALSIVIPLVTAVGAAIMRTNEDTDSASKSTQTYSDIIERLNSRLKTLNTESNKIKFFTEDEDVADSKAEIESLQKQYDKLKAEFVGKLAGLKNLSATTGGGGAAVLGVAIDVYLDKRSTDKALAELNVISDRLDKLKGLQLASDIRAAWAEKLASDLERSVQSHTMLNNLIKMSADLIQSEVNAAHAKQLEYMGRTLSESNALVQAMKDIVAAGAANDANLFADAMQRALDNGVLFSQLDLSSLVATAAANGWNLAASLQAAWVAATSGASGAANTPFIPSSGLGTAPIRSPLAPTSSIKPKGAVTNIDFGDYGSKGASGSSGGGGGGGSNPIADLQKQIDLEKELTNKTEAQKQIISALGMEWRSYSPEVISGLETQIQKQLDLNKEIEEQQGLYDSVSSAMEDSFMSIITRTETVEEAFRSMAYNIIEELYKVLVVQRMVGSFDAASGTGSGLVGLLSGVFSGRASGGSVRAGQPYLVGEKGPELIVPKHSGTVVNSQQTGAMGGASSQTVINEISVVGSDAAAVRREVAKMVPQIVEATKAAMMDSKRRGGQMASAFR